MSGAGDSETPSVSTSRSVRPPIGKSGGAPSAAITASTSAGSLAGKMPKRVADRVVEAGAGEIELDVPGLLVRAALLSRRRDRNVASTGLSRERPGASTAQRPAPRGRRGDAARGALELLDKAA